MGFVVVVLMILLGVLKLSHSGYGEAVSAKYYNYDRPEEVGAAALVEDSIHRHRSVSSIFGGLNGNTKGSKDDEESNYIVVGVRGNPDFAAASSRIRKLKSSSHVRVFALPSHDQFTNWMRRRRNAGVVPFSVEDGVDGKSTPPTVAVFIHNRNGIRYLTSDPTSPLISPSFSTNTNTKVVKEQMKGEVDAKRLRVDIGNEEEEEEPPSSSSSSSLQNKETEKEEEEKEEKEIISLTHLDSSSSSSSTPIQEAAIAVLLPSLVSQAQLRNKIITGYRAAEGKKFTNYKPIAQALTSGLTLESERSYGRKENPNYRNWRCVGAFSFFSPALPRDGSINCFSKD